VLELACGRPGSALALAAMGRDGLAVDISGLALGPVAGEAARRGLAPRITTVLADVPSYDSGRSRFALVLATTTGTRRPSGPGALQWRPLG
jgi:hypothetical protein